MKTIHLITAAAAAALAAAAMAAEPPNDPVAKSQPSSVQRAEVIAETKRAMASGELKFGPLVDYQAQFTPSPGRAPQSMRSAETRGGVPQGQTVAMEAAKPGQPAQPSQQQQQQPAQK
ncbi:MAG: DUF4148 domain-containing protein [Telluria sp.]